MDEKVATTIMCAKVVLRMGINLREVPHAGAKFLALNVLPTRPMMNTLGRGAWHKRFFKTEKLYALNMFLLGDHPFLITSK